MQSADIKPPKTYSEWVTVIDMLKAKTDDANVLAAMQQGTIAWQTGVAERFAKKLIEAINYRMNKASDKFQKDIGRANGQESAFIQALLGLRREMRFLANAINIPAIPEKDRETYHQLVIEQANKMQKSLEDSAKRDRSGRLASIVRNNRVNVF